MFHVLIDTCVWLDLAENPKHTPLLTVMEDMIKDGLLRLIVPRVIVDEFRKNRGRVEKSSVRSLASHFQAVKEAVNKSGGDRRRTKLVLSHLDDVNHRIPIVGGAAIATLDRVEKILTSSMIIDASDAIKARAADRALTGKAPCHHENKNSIADALIFETYVECVQRPNSAGQRYVFVSHNKNDFSRENGNQKLPHADLESTFSRIKSLYFINLAECLRRIEPSMVSEVMLAESWTMEPRGLSELLETEDLLFHQVWYNRHWNLRIAIQEGKVKIVDKETYPRKPGARETVQRDIWEGALQAARNAEKRYGKENLGPWDDFEWGMINGKLSAIRWMLGDEWDMLDT